MTKKERKLRIESLKKQLQLITLYKEEFDEKLGKRGTQELIDAILDEISYLRKI